ncbi:MAG: hypothetical protein AVDCRST_MAG35-152, partial [uncultured Quadrisphaera sp.]
ADQPTARRRGRPAPRPGVRRPLRRRALPAPNSPPTARCARWSTPSRCRRRSVHRCARV